MRDMEGKVALVAAGSRGLGRASARAIARRGAKVAICSRDEKTVAETAGQIAEEAGVETWHCSADLSAEEGVKKFIHGAAGRFGGVDVLVSNAGGPPSGRFADVTDELLYRHFDLNVMSAVRLVREALPYLRRRGEGRIIFLLSSSVREPIDNVTLSNILRPAVAGLSKSLARELADDKILVNVVAPGTILTDRTRERREKIAEQEGITFEEILTRVAKDIPLKRLGDPAEFGAMVAFLASPEASYITGGFFPVDGGRLHGI